MLQGKDGVGGGRLIQTIVTSQGFLISIFFFNNLDFVGNFVKELYTNTIFLVELSYIYFLSGAILF